MSHRDQLRMLDNSALYTIYYIIYIYWRLGDMSWLLIIPVVDEDEELQNQ